MPDLPFELWNMMLGFVKHAGLPLLADDWEPPEEAEGGDVAEKMVQDGAGGMADDIDATK